MKERAEQLGIKICPKVFYDTFKQFRDKYNRIDYGIELDKCLEDIFYGQLLEKPSVLDSSILEEGFCIRKDTYPKPEIFKIKAKSFLLAESNWQDKEIISIEEEN